MAPETRHWTLAADGCWQQHPEQGQPYKDLQVTLMKRVHERSAGA
jgi:hypothetical protein